MGRRRARYNQKARASSAIAKHAVPHANPRHKGTKVLLKKSINRVTASEGVSGSGIESEDMAIVDSITTGVP
ncbi:hypothetical protein HDU93_006900, partial [Gonapodya sp. JEL0774]